MFYIPPGYVLYPTQICFIFGVHLPFASCTAVSASLSFARVSLCVCTPASFCNKSRFSALFQPKTGFFEKIFRQPRSPIFFRHPCVVAFSPAWRRHELKIAAQRVFHRRFITKKRVQIDATLFLLAGL